MKNLVSISMGVAVVSLVVGIISGRMFTSLPFELATDVFLRFTDTCLLFAIALGLMETLKVK